MKGMADAAISQCQRGPPPFPLLSVCFVQGPLAAVRYPGFMMYPAVQLDCFDPSRHFLISTTNVQANSMAVRD